MKYILIIGKNKEIMDTLIRLVNSRPGWAAIPASSIMEAFVIFEGTHIDLVLLSSGLTTAEENKVKKQIRNAPVIQHYGGGSGLLYNELEASFLSPDANVA